MAAYLICWKPATENKEKGWPVENVAALAQQVRENGVATEHWRFSRVKDVKVGERVYLVQQGKRGHAILGYGRIRGLPVKTDVRRAEVEFEALIDPRTERAYASHEELHAITNQKGVWDTNGSGVLIPSEVERNLEAFVIGREPIAVTAVAHESNPDWTRDELILALDLYLRHRPNPPDKASQEIANLSGLLNRLGAKLFPASERSAVFRNANGVYMKLMNFRRLDPAYVEGGKKGLTRGAKGDEEVWKEFASDPQRCSQVAAAIAASLDDAEVSQQFSDTTTDESFEEAEEGRLLTRKHVARERNPKLVKRKREQALKKHGKLECQCCGFNFSARYGERGSGFIECHHTKPVATLGDGSKTHLNDLALICSNCHRMIHRRKPWLTMEELVSLLR